MANPTPFRRPPSSTQFERRGSGRRKAYPPPSLDRLSNRILPPGPKAPLYSPSSRMGQIVELLLFGVLALMCIAFIVMVIIMVARSSP